jgi:hypothetical protein
MELVVFYSLYNRGNQLAKKSRKTQGPRLLDETSAENAVPRDERVKQAIERAQARGGKELSMQRLGLAEVPEAVWSLSQLEVLYLASNKLHTVPSALGKFICMATRLRICPIYPV